MGIFGERRVLRVRIVGGGGEYLLTGAAKLRKLHMQRVAGLVVLSGDMCTCAFDFALQSGGNLPLSSCAAFIGLLHQLERLSGWVVQWGLSGWFREASMGRGTTVKRLRVSQPGEACGNFITTVRSLYAIFN